MNAADPPPKTSQVQPKPKRRLRWMLLALVLPALGLDFSTLLTGKHYGVPADAQALRVERAGMWMAWCMVGLLVVMATLVGAFVWRFRRRIQQPDPGLALLDELYLDAHAEQKFQEPQQPMPSAEIRESGWEKPADWWQQNSN